MLIGVGKGKDSFLSTMSGVMKIDDAPAYLAGYGKSLSAISDIMKDLKQGGVTTTKKVDVGGTAGLEVVIDMSAEAAALPKPILDLLVGDGGKITMTLVAVDAKTIVFRYTGADGLKDIVEAYKAKKPGLAADADVAKSTAQLPAGAQWAFYVSPQGTMELAGRLIGAAGLPVQIPPFPKTAPVGVGFKLSATGWDGKMFIPAAVLEGVGDLIKKFGQ
jgi:hypothetical protein